MQCRVIEDYCLRLESLHQGCKHALQDLAPAALDWTFVEGMNSFTILVVHICGAERYWIGDVALGDSSDRDRTQEFQARGFTRDELCERLDQTVDYARANLSSKLLPWLEQQVISARDGRSKTVGWALLHALEHTALHLGHMQIQRQLWEHVHAGVD